MAYHLPTFNLDCNVWHFQFGAFPPVGVPDDTWEVGLRAPRPTAVSQTAGVGIGASILWGIMFEKETDIRDASNASGPDILECPAGSGRYYATHLVDDVAKGHFNEFRLALVVKYGGWPTPIP